MSWLLHAASVGCAGILAIGLLVRTPRAVSSWAFVGGMAVLALEALLNGALADAPLPVLEARRLNGLRLIVLSFLPAVWLVFSLTYARGDAAEIIKRWRLPLLLTFIIPVSVSIGLRSLLLAPTPDDLAGTDRTLRLGFAGSLISVFLLAASVAILMNLERTFRASVGTMRWRIKSMLLGVGVLFLVRLYTSSQSLLFGAAEPALETLNSGALLVATILILRSLFRAGRFALDVYPSQSVLQSSLTVLLAGIYLLVVGLFAKIVAYVGGDTSFALKAFMVLIALVLGAVLLQSDRARLVVRRFVSRNFQRPLYDYRTVWRKFTEGTASRVEQADLSRTLVRLIAEMFQALSVTIWLLDPKTQCFVLGASTSLPNSSSTHPAPNVEETAKVLSHFSTSHEATDFELIEVSWADILRKWHPSEFSNGGHRVSVALVGRGELLGLIALGDRVGGAPFTLQDLDMLKCVADHAAANLYNVQLSERLVQAKELEAFQTMATFFVHDLKNAASTLKLMLQNLPVHFDDPEFRADALRGTAKTVTHIDHLIGRLSSLRHDLKMRLVPSDLNDAISQAVGAVEQGSGIRVVKNFSELPRIELDREQITKVITNFVLNAVEASPAHSPIHISTKRGDGSVTISIVDAGCGMTSEFIDQSLFKPFRTTKKGGLGIGMFQSKLIVEAHGGRISVISVPNNGTTFNILLPLPKINGSLST
jgi:putative PEP-CTERM system histidine kinase